MRLAITLILLTSLFAVAAIADVSDPKAIELTVYNGGFALVKDTRSIGLTRGMNTVEVQDVAARIDPTSILFKNLGRSGVSILEQNYQYDLINPNNILNKSVGQKLTVTRYTDDGKAFTETGTILSPISNGGLVLLTEDGMITLNPQGEMRLQKMPEGLHPKPTLSWLLRSEVDGNQDAQISYITDGLGWKADYVALINEDDTALDLGGWVTLNNQSGATYTDAKLTLMAGDVRRVQDASMARYAGKVMLESVVADAAPQFVEKSFFEYHMYTMERPTTIRDNETKQLSLLNATGAQTTKEFIYDARGQWFRGWWYPGRTNGDPGSGWDTSDYHKVNVVLEVKNSKENRMGMPLPAGKVRVYKLDDKGGQQFIGEDMIDHTPKDEKIRLYIGDAFDVVGDYKRTDYRKLANNVVEESFEVKIRNHKETPVTVKVVEHVWSDWEVTKSSHEYIKKDAHTIEFPITVPKDGETVITYTIRTAW